MEGTQEGVRHLQPVSISPRSWGRGHRPSAGGFADTTASPAFPRRLAKRLRARTEPVLKAKLTLKALLFTPASYLHLGVNSTWWGQ